MTPNELTPLQRLVVETYYRALPDVVRVTADTNALPCRLRVIYNEPAFRLLGEQLLEIAGNANVGGVTIEVVEEVATVARLLRVLGLAGIPVDPILAIEIWFREPAHPALGTVSRRAAIPPVVRFLHGDDLKHLTPYEWKTL